jgi:hypothetical protein
MSRANRKKQRISCYHKGCTLGKCVQEAMREAIAKIIDPEAFETDGKKIFTGTELLLWEQILKIRKQHAFEAADACIAIMKGKLNVQ